MSKLSPAKINQQDGDPQYNCYYHKFRQQNKSNVKSDSYLQPTKGLHKNKFPLPFTGVEYPFIDGGGITSCGREGIYADNKPCIRIYNDFEKSWLYSLPDKFVCAPNERPQYKKKSKMESKTNQIVFDCLNSSPYYTASYESEHSNLIDLNRDYVFEGKSTLEDHKTMTSGLSVRKDKYYSYMLPYYALEDEYDNTLVFESRFESGNLRRAFK